MTPLKRRIIDLIQALGPIPVSQYMALCLSDPLHGYYMSREPFGRAGDFTTSPEISQMFGELIGAWLAAAWQASGHPADAIVAELGPGRGTLMKDVVRTLGKLAPEFRRRARFRLIETSPRLRRIQAETLEGSNAPLAWLDRVEDLPPGPLFILGNEFFDAVPIRQYARKDGGWRERVIDLDHDGGLRFAAGPGSLDTDLLPHGWEAAPEGAIFELAPARTAIMEGLAAEIATHGGAGLFLDYGHVRPGLGDTLQAVASHRFAELFEAPGEADLTSHVDFAALASAARGRGLQAHLTTQGEFLLSLGLVERAGRLGAAADEPARERLRSEVERLAGPAAMGGMFKVLACLPPGISVPPFLADSSFAHPGAPASPAASA